MFVFIDIETTGLVPDQGNILEIAAVTTTNDFQVIGEPFDRIVRPGRPDWESLMDPTVREMHYRSGLTADVPVLGKPLLEVASEFVQDWFPKDLKTPMGGASVHFDRAWLNYHAPTVEGRFTHRNLDVSSVKAFFESVAPKTVAAMPQGRGHHRALDDVHDSLSQLRFLYAAANSKSYEV